MDIFTLDLDKWLQDYWDKKYSTPQAPPPDDISAPTEPVKNEIAEYL